MPIIFQSKDEIRRYVWTEMERRGIARFPLPPYNRIPNFEGAEEAAARIRELEEYLNSHVIKVNPDSPQRLIREYALRDGKTLVMPTPRLKKGFLVLKPRVVRGRERHASTIRGSFKYGIIYPLEKLPFIDFIVEGSVAVSLDCGRIGKGEGYAELEYAVLRELNRVEDTTPIATTVHDIQVFKTLPQDIFDAPIGIIATPTRLLRLECSRPRPKGIYWDQLSNEKLNEIPILRILKEKLFGE